MASPPEPLNQESCHDLKLHTLAEGSGIPSEDSSNIPQVSFSRLSLIREQQQTIVLQRTLPEYSNQQLAPPHKTFQSAWGLWHSWCTERKVNPISATLNDVLLFLTDRFNNGTAYRSVNVARSAISSCHPKIDGFPVGQHPLVVQLLKGMLNMRLPKPRYTHTWGVRLVTNYLDCLGKTKLLPLKLLSIKLAMLFALSCTDRSSPLAKLDLRVLPRKSFLHTCVSEKARLSRSTTSSLFCVFSTQ